MVSGNDIHQSGSGPAETPRTLAAALLTKPLRIFDLNHGDQSIVVDVKTLLSAKYLPELLFGAIPLKSHSPEGNIETYGSGNANINSDFARLSDTLLRLAATGQSGQHLDEGISTLVTLIGGVRTAEEEVKRGINPSKAKDLATVDEYLIGAISEEEMVARISGDSTGEPDMNAIDDIQSESMELYMWYKSGRMVLEEMLRGFDRIKVRIDQSRRDHGPSGP